MMGKKNWFRRLATFMLAIVVAFTILPMQASAVVVVDLSHLGIMRIEKTWDDNDDVLGIRPDEVYYDLYSYTGDWSGADNATLVEADIPVTLDYLGYEQLWYGTGADLEEMDTMIDENGNPYKFKFVEQVPEGYVESESVDPEIFVSDFNIGTFSTLEKIGPNQYQIPNFDALLETLDYYYTHRYDENPTTVLSTNELPLLKITSGSKTMFIPIAAYYAMSEPYVYNYGIQLEAFEDYLSQNYGFDTSIETPISINDDVSYYPVINMDIDEELNLESGKGYVGHNPTYTSSDTEYYPFFIDKNGILTMNDSVTESGYNDDTHEYVTYGVPNPYYETEDNSVTVEIANVTPLNRYVISHAKSTNKLKEPVNVTVTKQWDDDNNTANKRPTEIQVHLLANGVVKDTATLTEDNQWTYAWNDLPDYEAGVKLEYTVEEATMPEGYQAGGTSSDVQIETNDNGLSETNITYHLVNELTPEEEEPEEPDDEKPEVPKEPEKPKNEKPVTPDTGDASHLATWFTLMALAIISGVLALKKQQEQ